VGEKKFEPNCISSALVGYSARAPSLRGTVLEKVRVLQLNVNVLTKKDGGEFGTGRETPPSFLGVSHWGTGGGSDVPF